MAIYDSGCFQQFHQLKPAEKRRPARAALQAVMGLETDVAKLHQAKTPEVSSYSRALGCVQLESCAYYNYRVQINIPASNVHVPVYRCFTHAAETATNSKPQVSKPQVSKPQVAQALSAIDCSIRE